MLTALLAACGLTGAPVALMERIVAVESGGTPLRINVNGDSEIVHQPRDVREAVAMARWLLAHGYNFDAGIAQVNSSNFDRLGLSAETVFDTCTNLRAGLQILEECRSRAVARYGEGEAAEQAAASCYNTGDLTRGIRNGYAAAVAGATAPRRPVAKALADPTRDEPQKTTSSALTALGERVPDVFAEVRGR